MHFVLVASSLLAACDGGTAQPDENDASSARDAFSLDVFVPPGADANFPDAFASTPDANTPPSDTGPLSGGRYGSCGARTGRYFPASSWIYTDILAAPVAATSAATTAWLEAQGGWGGLGRFQIDTSIVVLDADASAPRVAPTLPDPGERYDQCDNALSIPLPTGGRIEGFDDYICPGRSLGEYNGDCHLLVADFSTNQLFESFSTSYESGRLYTTCNIRWDMTRDYWGPRPSASNPANWGIGRDCTSSDAAGFPIAPLLVSVGDVMSGRVEHVIRFILPNARMRRSAGTPEYVWPATHAGGPSASAIDAPIYGQQWRLRADFDPAARGLDPANPVVRAVVYGLQHYGMALADGGNIPLTFESDVTCGTTWDSLTGGAGMRVLDGIRPSDFEVLATGPVEERNDCVPFNR